MIYTIILIKSINMCDFEINYDFRPYLPDINIKNNIYNSCDTINNNTNVDINNMIFIININQPINSIYNDPDYILFGKKNSLYVNDYKFPSFNFFSYYDISTFSLTSNYQVINSTNEVTDKAKQILGSIGYNFININESQFEFKTLIIKESISSVEYTVLYFYFNLNEYISTQVNYNQYENLTYYDNKKYNVLIYPFYSDNSSSITYTQTPQEKYIPSTKINNISKSIKNIDFDNREIIKYYEKIDYKYFENVNFTMDEKTNMETLKNYALNIKNYVKYIDENSQNNTDKKNNKIINIGLNEISKLFYYSIDYNLKNKNTYTQNILNNKHINNNNTSSNQYNRYSYTMDQKIANINGVNTNTKNYSMYDYTTNTFQSTLYLQTTNYYLNYYYNIKDNANNQCSKLNILLHKILLFINPKIIDANYVLTNVNTSIYPLYVESNIINFGQDINKLQLYFIGDIQQTSIYYIQKYKIIFEFIDDTYNNLKFSYIIILGIAFYNGNYFFIQNLDTTSNTPLAYINYTILEESVSLNPSIYAINSSDKNQLFFYNNMDTYNSDNGVKKYYCNINYSCNEIYNNSNQYVTMYNFYETIPNIKINLKQPDNKYYNNVINVLKTKINNFIVNFINIDNNYNSYNEGINNIKKYINYSIMYDENIVEENTEIKYIEYFDYFPYIGVDYLSLDYNYVGKYSQTKVNDNLNNLDNIDSNSSFEVLPIGKYIKFNYINYSSNSYPSLITEEFVSSIKTINEISNYYFSLFIKLPYGIEPDNELNCVLDNDLINSTYSMGIGGNKTNIYLVLTDINNEPYEFYSEQAKRGIIYGIKLFNYTNYNSPNMKLPVVPNMYMNQYLNLNEFAIIMECFNNYTDVNNVLWDINQTYLNIHNFNSLKEIVIYDYKRFNSGKNILNMKEELNKFNYKMLKILFDNKVQLNYLRYCVKILIYLSNLYKAIKLIHKIYSYYEIIKINIILSKKYNNDYIENIIKYNIGQISNLFEINYNLSITSGTFESKIYLFISQMYTSNNITLENINDYQSYCVYITNYSLNKLPTLMDLIITNVSETNNIYHNLYYQIFEQIIVENINYVLGEQIIYDIDNLTNNSSIAIFDNLENNLNTFQKELLLKQINACLKSLAFNETKIDELYNLSKLMNNDQELNSNIVKNDYIYNTECYTTKTNIPKFKITDFLLDTIELINKLSNPLSNPNYIIYQKSISEGIITFCTNTINYFNDIINKISVIYIYLKNLPGIGINIYEPSEIGNFINLIGLFKENYTSFFQILNQNQINKFYEYSILDKLFDNLFFSCEEFIFYISLRNDFMNLNTIQYSINDYVVEDLYKIIKTNVFYDFMIKTIENIDNLVINKNSQLTIIYLEKIKNIFETKPNIYINIQTIIIIEQIIFELKNSSIPNTFINYESYYIIPYQDLLLLEGSFKWASFNFNEKIVNVIKNVNSLNISIFDTYYNNPQITDFYKQALGYTYLNTPYKYININNTDNTNL